MSELAALAPFGPSNPRPVFCAHSVDIVDGPRRLKERHLKMALRQDGRVMRAIAWRGAERHAFLEAHRAAVDVAFSLEQNQFNGETYLELTLCDTAPPGSTPPDAIAADAVPPWPWLSARCKRRVAPWRVQPADRRASPLPG